MCDIQIDFLEELCKLWPFTLERYYALKEKRIDLLEDIAEREKPNIEKAKQYLTALWYLRLKLEERVTLAGPEYQAQIKERCKQDFVFFINYWCWLNDPRMPEIGLSAKLPFIMYPAQERIIRHIETCYTTRQSCLIDKSREAGISWVVCALLTHHFLFVPGFSAILGSEKEEKVDMIGSIQPLMGKLRYILYNLPVWMRPEAFRQELPSKLYDNYRRLINPENGAEIKGEAGINIGRSGRASMVVIDESQDLSHPDAVDEALESVMNCRVDIGTPKGMNHFGQKKHSGLVLVESIHWYEDPRKNPDWRNGSESDNAPWMQYKEATIDPVVLAQEYRMDYQASVEGLIIDPSWARSAVGFDLPRDGTRAAGFDVAGGGKNKSVYVMRMGPVICEPHTLPFDTSTEAMWAALKQGEQDGIALMSYDADGIGESIWGQLKTSDYKPKFRIAGIHGSSKPSEVYLEDEGKYAHEKYQNKRAEVWFQMRERFRKTYEHKNGIRLYRADEMISIPDNQILKNQLCSPKAVITNTGKLGVESKRDMRRRGIESPDLADACAYALADYRGEGYIMDSFDYTEEEQFGKFDPNWEFTVADNYVSIVQADNMDTYGVCALYDHRKKKLLVYNEFVMSNAMPEEVRNEVVELANDGRKHIKEWVANDEMFKDIDKKTKTPWHMYRKAGVKLQRAYEYDERGGIMLVNGMFRNKMIQIHSDTCKRTFAQLREWRSKGGRPDKRLAFSRALCQLASRLRRKKLFYIREERVKEYGSQRTRETRVARFQGRGGAVQ